MRRSRVVLVGSVLLVAALLVVLFWGGPSGVRIALTASLQPGYYHAASAIDDKHAPGGFGPSNNVPRELAGRDWGARGAVSVVAFPDEPVERRGGAGFVVRIVNRTTEPVGFTASDSCLYLTQEARTASGTWRALEAPPEFICGNSFHRVYLKPDQYWEFAAARSRGTVATKVRFRLDQGREDHVEGRPDIELPDLWIAQPGGELLYSNEFDGRVSGLQWLAP